MAYDNTNKGALFKNDRKESPSHPDYKGTINVEGTEYWASGWIKVAGPNARNPGSKFLSVSLTAKEGNGNGPQPRVPQRNTLYEDDIPF